MKQIVDTVFDLEGASFQLNDAYVTSYQVPYTLTQYLVSVARITQQVCHTLRDQNTIEVSLSLASLAGTYSDPAYGKFTLCASSSTTYHCRAVLSTLHDSNKASKIEDALYAAWLRLWSDRLRIYRQNGTWTFQPTSLFPHGFGTNQEPFEHPAEQNASAEFSINEDETVHGMGIVYLQDVKRV
jgi:hypothetical protein